MGDFCWAELVKQGWCSPKLLLVVQRNSSVGSSRSAPATASPPASPWGLPELPGEHSTFRGGQELLGHRAGVGTSTASSQPNAHNSWGQLVPRFPHCKEGRSARVHARDIWHVPGRAES